MRKFILTSIAVLMSTAAFAADLPSRTSAPAAPVVAQLPFFVGVTAGGVFNRQPSLGAVAGYEINPYIRGEVAYDHFFSYESNRAVDNLVGNAIVQYPVGAFTPYVLAGAGYAWGKTADEAIYNVGGGVRYTLTRNIDIDARYRYINNYDNGRATNVGTLGISYRF